MRFKITEWVTDWAPKCLICNKNAEYQIKIENKYISRSTCLKHLSTVLLIVKNEIK